MYIRNIYFVLLIFLLIGCVDTVGIPTPNAKKSDIYLFPEIGLVSRVRFEHGVLVNEKDEVYSKYRKIIYDKVKKRKYFLNVTTQKKPYMMIVDYKIYSHTSPLETFATLLGNPSASLFGPDYKLSADLNVTILYMSNVAESYHYQKDFTSKYKNIKSKAKEYLNQFMQQLWKDMVKKSKMKRIKLNPN